MLEATGADSGPAATADPRATILAAPMSPAQIIAIAVTFGLAMLDGYDVFTVTFAAPALRGEWGIGQAQIGFVLSSGLLGMAAGSLFIAPSADILGRRKLIFLSFAMMILGTFWSAFTHNLSELVQSRILTGLGIGTMIAVGNPLCAEYASAKRRDLAVSLLNIGYPLGGVLGGSLAAYLLPTYGWRAIFISASVFGLIMLALSWLLLPEPVACLIARPKSNSLARVNDFLRRCGHPPVTQLPPPPANAKAAPISLLFRDGMTRTTLQVTAIYFLHVVTLFFIQSWVPSLVAGEGFSPSQAAIVAVWVNLGGIVGGAFIGATTVRFGLKPLVIAAMCGGAIMTAAFGAFPPNLNLLKGAAFVTGFFTFGGMIGLYAVLARTFPAHIRVSGTGLVIGVGRIGSAISPLAAGLLLAAGLGRPGVSLLMAAPTLVAAIVLLSFRVKDPTTP
jgi:AAHS family 4-hydroxybenzoate transporter-like MFS transporter